MTTQSRCWCGHHERYHGGGSCTFCDKQQINEPHPYSITKPSLSANRICRVCGNVLKPKERHEINEDICSPCYFKAREFQSGRQQNENRPSVIQRGNPSSNIPNWMKVPLVIIVIIVALTIGPMVLNQMCKSCQELCSDKGEHYLDCYEHCVDMREPRY